MVLFIPQNLEPQRDCQTMIASRVSAGEVLDCVKVFPFGMLMSTYVEDTVFLEERQTISVISLEHFYPDFAARQPAARASASLQNHRSPLC